MNEFPEALLGRTIERKPSQADRPDIQIILSPLESKESVMREFCTRCGMIAEVNVSFLDENNIPHNDINDGDYLETDACPDCPDKTPIDTERKLRIRNISEFIS